MLTKSKLKKLKRFFPWQKPKSVDEDPTALERVRTIMNSPGYIMAEEDINFLQQRDTMGNRLNLDYLKAELLLQEYGIEQTIVVFGSTRIVEKKTAETEVKEAQKVLRASPDSLEAIKALNIAERVSDKSRFYEIARQFGQIVGKAGRGPSDSRLTLMTGGGPGIMEAANRGSFDVGAKSIGLNISLPHEQFPNPYITPELCFQFHYFAIRKLHFLQRAKALVVFPGGFGTIDELFDVLTLIQTGKMEIIPIVLVGQNYWEKLFNMEFLEDEGVIDSVDLSLFIYAETAANIWQAILDWYDNNSELSL